MKKEKAQPAFSLLYPPEIARQPAFQHWGKNTPADLGLETLSAALSYEHKYEGAVRAILLELCSDPAVILYRQEVLADFLENPGFATQCAAVLPYLDRLQAHAEKQASGYEDSVRQTLDRLSELNTYLSCIRQLREALLDGQGRFHSRGLLGLEKLLARVESDETFQSLSQSLPELISRLSSVPSITIGINLDNELRPVEAMLLSINEKPFKTGSLLDKLIGSRKDNPEAGIGPLHSVPYEQIENSGRIVPLSTRVDPLFVPLFRDLHQVLKSLINPINSVLRQYSRLHAGLLLPLQSEIAFYLGAAALIRRLQEHGLPVCRPQVLAMHERVSRLEGMYNLLLALRRMNESEGKKLGTPIVFNDADFGPQGRIFILTGPNQGGKTVYTQAVGMAHLLFQAGLHVPAQQASLSPLDGIYTHFSTEEEFNSRQGRLGEEAQRLNEIFKSLTRHGLVLLNESLSSTSPRESFYLSLDIVRALRLYEARAIFATHLHELADDLQTLNAEDSSDSLVVSLVAGVELEAESPEPSEQLVTRTYQIRPGPPRGLSYARGIARQFGISFEQLAAQREARGTAGASPESPLESGK